MGKMKKPVGLNALASQWVKEDCLDPASLVTCYGEKDEGVNNICKKCNNKMGDHGWLGRNLVCPGDWVVSFVCNPAVFEDICRTGLRIDE